MSSKRATRRRADTSGTGLYSAFEGERLLEGNYSFTRTEGQLGQGMNVPRRLDQKFEKARHWFKRNWFIRGVTLLRYSFFHYGFRIKASDSKARKKVQEWEESNRKMYRRFAREAWLEWLVQDNAIALWPREGIQPPLVWPVECVKYSDTFGREELVIRHKLTEAELKKLKPKERAAMEKKQGELSLTKQKTEPFRFEVLRRERTGQGLGVPNYEPIFDCAAFLESLEAGDSTLAGACRRVMEQHRMGYEIKSGIHAGSKRNHVTPDRAKKFAAEDKGKIGHYKAATNFDHTIVQAANWPKAEVYDQKRYENGIMRLAFWSMPLGQMLLSKSLNPFLMPMLKAQAAAEREYVEEYLREVFIGALSAPEEIQIVWSNRCFVDARIAADLLKTGLASGPMSQGTFIEEAGGDVEQERENKVVEAALPKSQTTPIFSAVHGDPKNKLRGRNPGSGDGDTQ